MAALIRQREAEMVDACVIDRPTDPGQTPELDADGNVVPVAPERLYDGPCSFGKLQDAELQAETTDEQSGVPVRNVLRVPHGTGLRPGDLVTATAAAFSPSLVGDRFVIVRQSEKTYATSERYFLRGSSWLAGP